MFHIVRFLIWRNMMKRYWINCRPGRTEYIDVVKEMENEYLVRFIRQNDGHEKITEETITRHLFDICLKTGYLYETARETCSVA